MWLYEHNRVDGMNIKVWTPYYGATVYELMNWTKQLDRPKELRYLRVFCKRISSRGWLCEAKWPSEITERQQAAAPISNDLKKARFLNADKLTTEFKRTEFKGILNCAKNGTFRDISNSLDCERRKLFHKHDSLRVNQRSSKWLTKKNWLRSQISKPWKLSSSLWLAPSVWQRLRFFKRSSFLPKRQSKRLSVVL